MTTTFRLPASSLDQSFLDRVKEIFREKRIAIVISDDEEQMQRSKLPPGTPLEELLKFRGMISNEDAVEMMQAIEEGCEQIDPEDWPGLA